MRRKQKKPQKKKVSRRPQQRLGRPMTTTLPRIERPRDRPRLPLLHRHRYAGRSGVIPEHSYGERSVNRGVFGPVVCGVGFGGGSAPAVVDDCVATHMRGLVPHDRVCEMRSGAVCLAASVAGWGCSQCSLGSLLASLRRCALLAKAVRAAASPSSRAPSSDRRVRARWRRRRSGAACLGPRAPASVRAGGGRSRRPGLARWAISLRVCAPG